MSASTTAGRSTPDPRVRSPRGAAQVRQVPAVTRAVAILRLLGRNEESLGVNAIARALRLIPSTCLHILRVLVAEELVTLRHKWEMPAPVAGSDAAA